MVTRKFRINKNILKTLLKTNIFAKRFFEIESIDSTNNRARRIAESGGEEGTLIIAGTQLKGRGRFQRNWKSPLGGLWFSLVLRTEGNNPKVLPLIFGASLSKAIQSLLSLPCKFNWPNDLFIGDRKVGGILLESKYKGDKLDYIIAGFGINVNFFPEELGDDLLVKSTTLIKEIGKEVSITSLLAAILNRLEEDYLEYLQEGSKALVEKYKSRCMTIGRRVKIIKPEKLTKNEIMGIAIDILPDGGLLIKTDDGKDMNIYNFERLFLLD